MAATAYGQRALADLGRAALRWLLGWWRIVHVGARMLVLALSPASYRADNRRAIARQLVQGTAPMLLWFSVLSALLTVVLTRIVTVTALSYGLSRYALEMVIRVLVLELIPLVAALFVALRTTIPAGTALAALRRGGQWRALEAGGLDPLRRELLPRVLGGLFAVFTLAAVSGAVALVLVYLTVYGFTPWGLPAYNRMFGQIFHPAVTLIFVIKTVFFALAVALVPMVSALYDPARAEDGGGELRGLVRMFALLLLIEVASLVGNYY